MSTYNTADLRRQNRSRVFRYIFDSETPVTKQEIAQSLSLSLPTVGQNLKELQECGLLETQGFTPPVDASPVPSAWPPEYAAPWAS